MSAVVECAAPRQRAGRGTSTPMPEGTIDEKCWVPQSSPYTPHLRGRPRHRARPDRSRLMRHEQQRRQQQRRRLRRLVRPVSSAGPEGQGDPLDRLHAAGREGRGAAGVERGHQDVQQEVPERQDQRKVHPGPVPGAAALHRDAQGEVAARRLLRVLHRPRAGAGQRRGRRTSPRTSPTRRSRR